jgi:hypothetical protein
LQNVAFEEGFPLNLRRLYSLQVELRSLDGGSPNRQETMNQPDRFQMRFDQMPNGKGKSALRLSLVEQPVRPIPGSAIPPRTAKLTASSKYLLHIGSWLRFLLEQHGLFSRCRHPNLSSGGKSWRQSLSAKAHVHARFDNSNPVDRFLAELAHAVLLAPLPTPDGHASGRPHGHFRCRFPSHRFADHLTATIHREGMLFE